MTPVTHLSSTLSRFSYASNSNQTRPPSRCPLICKSREGHHHWLTADQKCLNHQVDGKGLTYQANLPCLHPSRYWPGYQGFPNPKQTLCSAHPVLIAKLSPSVTKHPPPPPPPFVVVRAFPTLYTGIIFQPINFQPHSPIVVHCVCFVNSLLCCFCFRPLLFSILACSAKQFRFCCCAQKVHLYKTIV